MEPLIILLVSAIKYYKILLIPMELVVGFGRKSLLLILFTLELTCPCKRRPSLTSQQTIYTVKVLDR
jgi:hypothetical protein